VEVPSQLVERFLPAFAALDIILEAFVVFYLPGVVLGSPIVAPPRKYSLARQGLFKP
jgi:hypothetical protein